LIKNYNELFFAAKKMEEKNKKINNIPSFNSILLLVLIKNNITRFNNK
jgi:hypothetical protein